MALPIIGSLFDLGKTLVERLIPDPKMKAEALLELQKLEQSGDLAIIAGQNRINEIEAASPTLFVSGWRPCVGWVCALSLAFQLVVGPLLSWGSAFVGRPIQLPVLETELLYTLLAGMLGLGGMRTVEKLQKVASK